MEIKKLTYNEETKNKKLTFKQIKLILIAIIILVLTLLVLFYIFIYQNDTNKLKRYLKEDGFICNNKVCSKDINELTYNIDVKDGSLNVDSPNYSFVLSNAKHTLEIKKDNLICTYEKMPFSKYEEVNEEYTYTRQCKVYIKVLNEMINNYNKILDKSKVDVNKLEK